MNATASADVQNLVHIIGASSENEFSLLFLDILRRLHCAILHGFLFPVVDRSFSFAGRLRCRGRERRLERSVFCL